MISMHNFVLALYTNKVKIKCFLNKCQVFITLSREGFISYVVLFFQVCLLCVIQHINLSQLMTNR